MNEDTRKALVLEMQALIEEVAKGTARLKEIQDILLASVGTQEKIVKPPKKYWGPDPDFKAPVNQSQALSDSLPNIAMPKKAELDAHTVQWDSISKH